jgi:carboxyl-terminal processing protease
MPPKANKFQIELLRKYSFFNFTAKYFGTHDTKLSKDWAPDTNVMNDFHAFLLKDNVQFTEAEYAENNEWTKQQLRREMYITAFSVEDARKLGIETDPVVLKGIESLTKAKSLQDTAKKMIVQRVQQKSDR